MSTLDHGKRFSVERRDVRAFRDLACNQVARAIDEKGYLDQAFATLGARGKRHASSDSVDHLAAPLGESRGRVLVRGRHRRRGIVRTGRTRGRILSRGQMRRCDGAEDHGGEPPAQLQASRGACFHRTYPPTRCEVHAIQTFAMPTHGRAESHGAVADARFRRAEIRRTPARRRCGATRLSNRPARYFSRFAASSTMLRSALLLTSSVDLTKPRSRVISTFRCSAARSGSMLGSW